LLSDFEPKGKIAREYGVYRNQDGISERATFVIDKDGVIAWRDVSPVGINPGAAGPLEAVEKLSGQTAGASA
jgi:peroxiredoxin